MSTAWILGAPITLQQSFHFATAFLLATIILESHVIKTNGIILIQIMPLPGESLFFNLLPTTFFPEGLQNKLLVDQD